MPLRRSAHAFQRERGDENDAKEDEEKEDAIQSCEAMPAAAAAGLGRRLAKYRSTLMQGLIEYETPRLVKVHNVWLGIVIRISQALVIAYVATYAIMYERGYQVSRKGFK